MSITSVLIMLIPLQVITVVLSFGILLAYLERRRMFGQDILTSITVALLCSLPGILNIPMIFTHTNFPTYGIRFTLKERSNYWIAKRHEILHKKVIAELEEGNKLRPKRYRDIWEN